MVDLGSLAESDKRWSLEEFVEVANHYLEQVLSQLNQEDAKKRFREPVTARLVRYYGSLSLIDKPEKIGREVRYGYRQLLQVLAARFLLQQGHKIQSIHDFVSSSFNEDLFKLLVGQVELVVQAEEKSVLPNFSFRNSVSAIGGIALSGIAGVATGYTLSKRNKPIRSTWVEVNVRPELKLLVSPNFVPPKSEEEFYNLLEEILKALLFES